MPSRTVRDLDLPPLRVRDHRLRGSTGGAFIWTRRLAGMGCSVVSILGLVLGSVCTVGAVAIALFMLILNARPSIQTDALLPLAALGIAGLVVAFVFSRLATAARRRPWEADVLPAAEDRAWNPQGERRSSFARRGVMRKDVGPRGTAVTVVATVLALFGLGFATTVTLILLGLGVVYLVFAAFRKLTFGEVVVTYTQFPYELGQDVRLLLRTSERGMSFRTLSATLRCVQETYKTPSLRFMSGVQSLAIWSECIELEPPHEMPEPGSDIELVFHPPSEAPPTRFAQPLPTYWELRVEGEAAGGRFDESFLVPVYGAGA